MAIEHENTYSLVFDPSVLVPRVKQSITVTNDQYLTLKVTQPGWHSGSQRVHMEGFLSFFFSPPLKLPKMEKIGDGK
jgi:hypothetical protein